MCGKVVLLDLLADEADQRLVSADLAGKFYTDDIVSLNFSLVLSKWTVCRDEKQEILS